MRTWLHTTRFLMVRGRKFAQASCWGHPEDPGYCLFPHGSDPMQRSSCAPAARVDVCAQPQPPEQPGYQSPTIRSCMEAQYHAGGGVPGFMCTATQFTFKERPLDTGRRRSYFNFIGLFRFPFSELKVTISISLEEIIGDLAFLHSFTTVQNNHRPVLKI